MSDIELCYRAARRILDHRFNSERELRTKLAAKRFDKSAIDATVARLTDENWLDDARFAASFVRSRVRKRIGKQRVRQELIAAGVSREAADRAVRENLEEDAEREGLEAAFRKQSRVLKRRLGEDFLASSEGRKKMTAYLLKQGYDSTLVESVVEETPVADD